MAGVRITSLISMMLIPQHALYIHKLLKAKDRGLLMAEEPKSVCECLDIELDKLSADDKVNLIGEICDELTA
jgi:hypothetical protein